MLIEIQGKTNEEILVVSSRQIAEDFEKQHKDVLESISNLISRMGVAENSASLFIESKYQHEQNNQTFKEYLLTRDGFSLLVMGFTGSKALEWKLKYINAFNGMERQLKRLYEERKQWEIERAKGVLVRHILTDTIKMKVTESPNKKFMYPNYTKMIYKFIFGKTFDELKKEYNIKEKESLRDYLTSEQLKEVEHLEMLVSSLIGLGMGYEEIKGFIGSKYVKQIA